MSLRSAAEPLEAERPEPVPVSEFDVTALETTRERREHYRANMQYMFGVTAALYYATWGDFFHLAIFEPGDDPHDFDAAMARTHARYFDAIHGTRARHIVDLACGGGAMSEWMAERTQGDVLGVDLTDAQCDRARARLMKRPRHNLRFVQHDLMTLDELAEGPFDAAICLDAACYLPDRPRALRAIAGKLSRGARFLLVDWCRAEHVTSLQRELVLEPFYRAWGIAEMETVQGYRRVFERAGLHLCEEDDLSDRVAPNWQRAYDAANRMLTTPLDLPHISSIAATALRYGTEALSLAKDQFQATLLIKAAADSGLLRYVAFMMDRS